MPSGPQNVLNTIGSYGAKPIDSTVYQNWLNSPNNRTGKAPYTLPSYASSYQPPGWSNMDPSGGVYGSAPGVGYDAASIASGITPTPPLGGWGNPQPLGIPTTNQPGVPFLGSTNVIPGTGGGFSQSTPDYINLLNQLNLGAQQAANVGRIPGEAGLEQQSSGNIAQELAGQLPQDVLNLIQQQGAERGVMTGSPGSPNAEAATLAALGLTSLGLQQQGQQDLSAAAARNPAARPIDLSGMLLTPYEAGQLNLRSRESTPIASPLPYTGPGSGGGGMPPMLGGQGNDFWSSLFAPQGGTPSWGINPAGNQMSDQEFQAWQDYVMGQGQEPGTAIATSTSPFTTPPNITDSGGQMSDAEYQNWWNSIMGGDSVDPGFPG